MVLTVSNLATDDDHGGLGNHDGSYIIQSNSGGTPGGPSKLHNKIPSTETPATIKSTVQNPSHSSTSTAKPSCVLMHTRISQEIVDRDEDSSEKTTLTVNMEGAFCDFVKDFKSTARPEEIEGNDAPSCMRIEENEKDESIK